MHSCKKKGVVICIILLFLGMVYSPISNGFENKEDTYDYIEVCLPEFAPSSTWFNATHLDNIDDAVELINPNGIILIHPCSDVKSYFIKREGVLLTKPMTLKGISRDHNIDTIIHGFPTSPYVFSIRSDNVTIENLTICDAAYPNEPSSICGGIIVHEFTDRKEENINITNNIIKNNSNGIIIVNQNQNNEHCINIIGNIIKENGKNGISVNDGTAIIYKNSIHNNLQDGISIWSESCVRIENNEIFDNTVGIWNDQGKCNYIANNSIYDNAHDGICFYNGHTNKSSSTCCKKNIITNNTIKGNHLSGIFLYFSNNNKIYNNTIINNKDSGIRFEYHLFFNDNLFDKATSKNNEIYHNNFINNGDKRIYNAIDSLDESTGNRWYNETLKQGNYWSDYKDRYLGDTYDPDLYHRNGSWIDSKDYGLPYKFLSFYYNLHYYKIYLKFRPKTYDKWPMCRYNGWLDGRPDRPIIIPFSDNITYVNNSVQFYVQSKDPNNDKIKYGFNWTSKDNDSCCDFENLTVEKWREVYYNSSQCPLIVDKDITWLEEGVYYLRVRAIDSCEDGGTDGPSILWSKSWQINVSKNT